MPFPPIAKRKTRLLEGTGPHLRTPRKSTEELCGLRRLLLSLPRLMPRSILPNSRRDTGRATCSCKIQLWITVIAQNFQQMTRRFWFRGIKRRKFSRVSQQCLQRKIKAVWLMLPRPSRILMNITLLPSDQETIHPNWRLQNKPVRATFTLKRRIRIPSRHEKSTALILDSYIRAMKGLYLRREHGESEFR